MHLSVIFCIFGSVFNSFRSCWILLCHITMCDPVWSHMLDHHDQAMKDWLPSMKIHWGCALISSWPNLGRQKLLLPPMDDVKSSFFLFPPSCRFHSWTFYLFVASMNECCRTKLKQTEVDREVLQRCCETLTEENRRLLKELQELRAIKVAAPCVIAHDYYMPLPAATLTMCPSCERVATVDNRSVTFSKPGYSHFSQSPAACWGKRENSVPRHWWFFQGILLHSPRRSSRICVTLWSRQRQEGLKM
jgi:hypothetical protein